MTNPPTAAPGVAVEQKVRQLVELIYKGPPVDASFQQIESAIRTALLAGATSSEFIPGSSKELNDIHAVIMCQGDEWPEVEGDPYTLRHVKRMARKLTGLMAGAAGGEPDGWQVQIQMSNGPIWSGCSKAEYEMHRDMGNTVRALFAHPPVPVRAPRVTDAENEKFSRDVSNFKGSDPEATKYALEQFAASRLVTGALPANPEPQHEPWMDSYSCAVETRDGTEYVLTTIALTEFQFWRHEAEHLVRVVSNALAATPPSAAPVEPIPAMHLADGSSNPDWLAFKYSVLNPASDMMRAVMIEREACAVICDQTADQYAKQARGGDNSGASDHREGAARECAADIRALRDVSAPPPGEVQVDAARELERLRALINTPQTEDWMSAVELEAAHQQERWGAEHDEGKEPQDWYWLLGYLAGKAVASFAKGDTEKGLHHTISSGAVLLNWHRHATGQMTGMRPGIADPDAAIASTTPPVNSGGA